MAVDKLVPTANASPATILASNDYTAIDETVAGSSGSDLNVTNIDDQTLNSATWGSLSSMTNNISSVTSATFRVKVRVVNPGSGDTYTWQFRLTVGGSTYDVTFTDTDQVAADGAFTTRENTGVGTSFTRAQYEAATVALTMPVYNKDMGPDGIYLDIDAFELEIDYTPSAGSSTFSSFNEVLEANITSINGVSFANISSINDLPI